MEQHCGTLRGWTELPESFVGTEQDSLPGKAPHPSMAEGPGSWKDFTPARGDDEAARGAVASLLGAADAEDARQAQHSGLHGVDPAWEEMRGAAVVAEVEEQFLHLAIRKQVSYR